MENDQQTVIVQNVEDYLAQRTEDGAQMGLVLKVASGLEGFAFSNDDFATFAATILKTTSTDPQLSSPGQRGSITVALPAQGISFEHDPAQSSIVTVACHLGSLQLTLSLDAYTFFRSLKAFMERRRELLPADPTDHQEKRRSLRANSRPNGNGR